MKTILYRADTRGHEDHGWLNTYHTFSFANYYDPQRIQFGVLRVLNDDTVAGGMGFDTHPHKNMEIISIPLEGDLLHKDSMGNEQIIKHGDVQVMSAGKGIFHSEYNKSANNRVKFLQIWIFPNKKEVEPRYQQMSLNVNDRKGKLQLLVAPIEGADNLWIHQQAWLHMGLFEKGESVEYNVKTPENGVYAFVLKGSFNIGSETLNSRDGMGISDINKLTISAQTNDAEILLIDAPML